MGNPDNTIVADSLTSGAKLYVARFDGKTGRHPGCPITSADSSVATTGTSLTIEATHDCDSSLFSTATIIWRRSTDHSSVYLYKTTGDTSAALTKSLMLTRGSPDVYVVESLQQTTGSTQLQVKGYDSSSKTFTVQDSVKSNIAVNTPVFVNGLGPLTITSAVTAADSTFVVNGGEGTSIFGVGDFDSANIKYPVHAVASDSDSISAGNILLLAGKRYKVRAVGSAGVVSNAKITLTEVFAGSQVVELCENCVTG